MAVEGVVERIARLLMEEKYFTG